MPSCLGELLMETYTTKLTDELKSSAISPLICLVLTSLTSRRGAFCSWTSLVSRGLNKFSAVRLVPHEVVPTPNRHKCGVPEVEPQDGSPRCRWAHPLG